MTITICFVEEINILSYMIRQLVLSTIMFTVQQMSHSFLFGFYILVTSLCDVNKHATGTRLLYPGPLVHIRLTMPILEIQL